MVKFRAWIDGDFVRAYGVTHKEGVQHFGKAVSEGAVKLDGKPCGCTIGQFPCGIVGKDNGSFGLGADFFKCGIDGKEREAKLRRLIGIEKFLK